MTKQTRRRRARYATEDHATVFQRFSLLSWKSIVAVHSGGMALMLAIAVLASESFSAVATGLMVFGFGSMATLVTVAVLTQVVEITGCRIRVKQMATFYRWRAFDAAEVKGMRWFIRPQGGGGTLQITLKASPQRNWNMLELHSLDRIGVETQVDTPVFLAVHAAIKRTCPGIHVINLPPDYGGAML